MIHQSGNKTLSKFGFPTWKPLYAHTNEGVINMKIKAEKALKLDDGEHEGVIEDIKYREEPYNYTDVVVKVGEGTLSAGYPSNLIEGGLLRDLLDRFGANTETGKDYEVEEFLTKGKAVKFSVVNKAKDGKKYANIVRETLRPKE